MELNDFNQMVKLKIMCKKCGNPIQSDKIFRTSTCSFCGADLHSCINCVFYSPESHYGCRETVDELVKDKERANFCDNFKASSNFSDDNSSKKSQDAKNAFNSLFSN